jgi:hypothetical protein
LRQHILVPTAPSNLFTAPNVYQIDLTWSASSPDGGTPILDYIIEYKKASDPDTAWRKFGDGVGLNRDATVTGLDADTPYRFRVYARNTAQEAGPYSLVVGGKTLARVAPRAPTNLVARVANTQINLTWTASVVNADHPAVRDYIVEYRRSGTSQWLTFNDGVRTTPTSADVTGLTNGVSYDFRVQAKNTETMLSPFTSIVTRTPSQDDKCNNIAGIQDTVPQNLKRNTQGDCVCINEGILESAANPAICTLTCAVRLEPAKPQFKVIYDE